MQSLLLALSEATTHTANAKEPSFADRYLTAGRSFELLSDESCPKSVQQVPTGSVAGTRNTALYNAHSYHTKVPPEAIVPFLEHFTRPGDVVLDPFAGSGMTGVAAVITGRRCVLNDLAVISGHLGFNHTRPCDADLLRRTFDGIYDRLLPRFKEWYRTSTPNGGDGYVHYTIWSKVYLCPSCDHRFTMWSVTDKETGRVGRELHCPSCSHRASRQSWRPVGNEPSFISYEHTSSAARLGKDADSADRSHIASFKREDVGLWYPDVPVKSEREMYIRSALHLQGVKTVADFYTPRNLLALATLWDEIQRVQDTRIRFALAFAFTNTAWHGTKMRRYNARGGQRPLTGTLYIPQLSSEVNVLEVMRNKIGQLESFYRGFSPIAREVPLPLIQRGSATQLAGVPDASIDYVFTDPPFGSNIFYADCNLIWESWLGALTDDTLEAVVNRSRTTANGGKTVADYGGLMLEALLEMHRVLKPGGWVTLVFHNTDADVWGAIQSAAAAAGFRIDGAAGLDRKERSHKGYKGRSGEESVAHFDVVLSMQKELNRPTGAKPRKVTETILRDTLNAASREDPRVGASLQWAHSVAMRRLLEEGYDLRDVSYDRVASTWQPISTGPTSPVD